MPAANSARDTEHFGWLPDDPDPAGRDTASVALRATMRAHETVDGVLFGSVAWIVTVRRGDPQG